MLVVGHNPDFAQVVHDLTGARIDLKKGGVAGVRMRGSRAASCIVLLRPRELARICGEPPAERSERLAVAARGDRAAGRRRRERRRVGEVEQRELLRPRRPAQTAVASTSMRFAAPSTPTICPPSRRPLPGSATSLTQIGPAPG